MKKSFFHVSARVIIAGVSRCIEKLLCIEFEESHSAKDNNQYFPLADIRKYIVEGASKEANKHKRITFLLDHIEEISEDDYDEMKLVFKEYDDTD